MFSCQRLSLSFSTLTFCKPFRFHPFHVLFPLSNFSLHLYFHFTVCFCSETSFVLLCVDVVPLSPSFLASRTATCPSSACDAYRGFLCHLMLFIQSEHILVSHGRDECAIILSPGIDWRERQCMAGWQAVIKRKKWWIKDERKQKKKQGDNERGNRGDAMLSCEAS